MIFSPTSTRNSALESPGGSNSIMILTASPFFQPYAWPSLRNPLAHHPLRLGDLIRCHLGEHKIAVLNHMIQRLGIGRGGRGRQAEPHEGLHVILRHASAVGIQRLELAL